MIVYMKDQEGNLVAKSITDTNEAEQSKDKTDLIQASFVCSFIVSIIFSVLTCLLGDGLYHVFSSWLGSPFKGCLTPSFEDQLWFSRIIGVIGLILIYMRLTLGSIIKTLVMKDDKSSDDSTEVVTDGDK